MLLNSWGVGLRPAFFAPLSDAGAGAVSLALNAGSGSATFARATSATCWDSTGLLLTVGTGVARSTYTELVGGTYLGYLNEEARTNTCIRNRDFTNAAWVMTTMTPLKDQVGIDGAANSASSLLATGANATAAQTVTLAAVNRPFSVYVKRLVGTGNIDLAQDGASFTTQSVANDGLWHRCTLVASQLNPVLTVRLATNGDKIAVDYAMLEDSGGAARTFPLSPIATTVAAVTRNVDLLPYPTAGNIVGTVGTAYAEVTIPNATPVIQSVLTLAGTAQPLYQASTGELSLYDGTGERKGNALTNNAAVKKVASMWNASPAAKTYIAGVASASLTFDGDLNVGATMYVGSNNSGTPLNGTIKNLKLWQVALTDGQIAAL